MRLVAILGTLLMTFPALAHNGSGNATGWVHSLVHAFDGFAILAVAIVAGGLGYLWLAKRPIRLRRRGPNSD